MPIIETLNAKIDSQSRELFLLKNLIAPYIGLKPFFSKNNKNQIIWAETKEEAESVSLGEDIFKFVDDKVNRIKKVL